ncbi:MAG: histidine kinase N-terminal 7TM domain-containing protein [Methanosarcina sp.]|jgi:PAS domain S-box-containing protein|nr:histidine kinase N-terminal 7TM domain-containing protein [Methanosarcina sp.]MDD3874436.1 histidine kinase N-terminal 7TM domain-containing protein [Methanosarcina sp.]MDD4523650.1 histidine kinase N-terminal 7TM domain-containing protein [Methanosarcina sp.]HHV25195.1 PAS domain S-box protein [Methanosarcina sp.]
MGVLIFSGLISVLLAIKVYKAFNYRRIYFSRYFIFVMLSMSLWSVNYAFEIGLTDIELKYFFACLEYVGIAFAPVAWFLFAAEYSGVYNEFLRKYEKAFFMLPLLPIFSMLTNSFHGMHFLNYYLDNSGGFPLLVLVHGPFFWIFYIYSFTLIFLGIFFFFKKFVHLTPPYKAQAAIALTAACIPVLGNIFHIRHIGIFAFLDPTPFTFTFTGVILFWGVMQHEFLNIIPIARENVIESMSDGYIVIDLNDSIVDINKAALELAGKTKNEVIGGTLNELFEDNIDISQGENNEGNFSKEISLKNGLETKFFTLSVSPLVEKSKAEGKLVMIHDISETYRYQEALRQANRKINLMSNITRHDILNQVNVLSGYTELILETLPEDVKNDSRIERYLKNLNKSIETIHSQITFTKDYQELGIVSPTWQSISNTAREAAIPFFVQSLKFSIEESCVEVYADSLLKKVFYNLFDNARAHGEHVTEISVISHRAADSLVIEVKDNGIGVPPVMKDLIFEKSVGKNTGLGLFLVSGILSITGIEIKETGIEGMGATFEITVPPGNWRESAS